MRASVSILFQRMLTGFIEEVILKVDKKTVDEGYTITVYMVGKMV